MTDESRIELRAEPAFQDHGFVVVIARSLLGDFSVRVRQGHWLELPPTSELMACGGIHIPNDLGEATYSLLPDPLPASPHDLETVIDGTAYTLKVRTRSDSATYKWWSDVPTVYAPLKPLVAALLELARTSVRA
jgi:hypothetical protein